MRNGQMLHLQLGTAEHPTTHFVALEHVEDIKLHVSRSGAPEQRHVMTIKFSSGANLMLSKEDDPTAYEQVLESMEWIKEEPEANNYDHILNNDGLVY